MGQTPITEWAQRVNRRDFLEPWRWRGDGDALGASPSPAVRVGSTPASRRMGSRSPDSRAASYRRRFPDRDFDITRYGARPDASFDNTDAIRVQWRRAAPRAADAWSFRPGGL